MISIYKYINSISDIIVKFDLEQEFLLFFVIWSVQGSKLVLDHLDFVMMKYYILHFRKFMNQI